MLKQINNNFASIYWIDSETAEVFKKNAVDFIKIKCYNYTYRLKTTDGTTRAINIKPLYRLCFNKNFCIDKIQDLPGEEWKEIKDTDGMYYISNCGRVKSLKGYNAIILKPKQTVLKYDRVDIIVKGIAQTRTIHSLVAEYFLQRPDTMNVIIHHINENTKDNTVNNLVYMDRADHTILHKKKKKEKEV